MASDKSEITPFSDATKFSKLCLQKVGSATRQSNCLPKVGETYELYSSFKIFSQLLQTQDQRVNKIASNLLKHVGYNVPLNNSQLDDDEKLDRIVDANDAIFERISIALDEASGVRKKVDVQVDNLPRSSTISTSWNKPKSSSTSPEKSLTSDSLTPDNQILTGSTLVKPIFNTMPKPQLAFKDMIDNSNTLFRPKLREKHNMKAKTVNMEMLVDGEICSAESLDNDEQEDHPYRYELITFTPNQFMMQTITKPQEFKSLAETPFELIDSEEKLKSLTEELLKQTEFAVDLEHHDYRTFLGLTCLMQISTRTKDFVIDTLKLWKYMHILNDPFTNPNIVKVFHGADMDVQWLQRDFGIYLVGLFDTGQALRLLRKGRFALRFLVNHYCAIDLDKKYTMSDWRTRPLPEDWIKYAREDTHYLLYSYDRIRMEIFQRGKAAQRLLNNIYSQSKNIALTEYVRPLYSEENVSKLLIKAKKRPDSRQLFALKELHSWRDSLARINDESLRFTLPDQMLMQIAEVLPREMQGILACCNPVPQIVKQELLQLHEIILKARDRKLEAKVDSGEIHVMFRKEKHALLTAVHDFSHIGQNEEMFDERNSQVTPTSKVSSVKIKENPDLLMFAQISYDKYSPNKVKVPAVPQIAKLMQGWASPYERYLLALEEKQKEEKIVKTETKNDTTPKQYSHHDPSSGKSSDTSAKKSIPEGSDPFARLSGENPTENVQEDPLQFKANRKRKKDRNAYLLPLAPVLGSEIKDLDTSVLQFDVPINKKGKIVDYNKMDASIFEKRVKSEASTSKEPAVFDPFKNLGKDNKKNKKGKKKNEKRIKSKPKTMMFGNNKEI